MLFDKTPQEPTMHSRNVGGRRMHPRRRGITRQRIAKYSKFLRQVGLEEDEAMTKVPPTRQLVPIHIRKGELREILHNLDVPHDVIEDMSKWDVLWFVLKVARSRKGNAYLDGQLCKYA
jgi:hypothetical protein